MSQQQPKNVHQRIHEAMGEVDYVRKNEKSGMQYKFVSHDAVTGIVRPALHKAGVVYYPQNMKVNQDGNRTECVFDVRFMNIENQSDFIDVPTFGYGIDNQDKGPGKAISYGVKYALLKTLGLETGDDPERDSIDHEGQKQAWSKQRDFINAINALKSTDAATTWLSENERDIGDLPQEEHQVVMDQYEARLVQLANGDKGGVVKYKFNGVKEQDEWLIEAQASLNRRDTIEELTGFTTEFAGKIKGLDKTRTDLLRAMYTTRKKQIEDAGKDVRI